MICTWCGVEEDSEMETQEWLVYHDVGGYSSRIGDMLHWEVVICQECLVTKMRDAIVVWE